LTGLTTIGAAVAATSMLAQPWVNLVMVVITSAVAVLATVEGIRKPSELWIHERTTRYALADLQRELEYRCVAGINSDTVDECFKRLQALLGASGEKWNKGIARQPSSVTRPDPPGGHDQAPAVPDRQPAGRRGAALTRSQRWGASAGLCVELAHQVRR
jgi:hypothetical protein